MRRRNYRVRDNSHEATFDLNLAPMMDMMVSIIPFMLLSAAFLTVVVIDVPLPVPVAQALQKDREKQEREVSIALKVVDGQGINIDVTDLNGKQTHYSVGVKEKEFDYSDLHRKLIAVKQIHPKVFRVDLSPGQTTTYDVLVRIMDQARNVEKSDPKILIDGAESPLLFPDVVFANLME